MFSKLTYQVVTLTHDCGISSDIVVDWALDMMRLGYDDENLYILAGLTKPVMHYEMINYLRAAMKVLNLPTFEGEDAVFSQAIVPVLQTARRQNVKVNIEELCDIHTGYLHLSNLSEFYDVYWAWRDLEEGEHQWYVKANITLDNIEDYAVGTARKWLRHNLHRHKTLFGFDMPNV
jgi:hypothetical protein